MKKKLFFIIIFSVFLIFSNANGGSLIIQTNDGQLINLTYKNLSLSENGNLMISINENKESLCGGTTPPSSYTLTINISPSNSGTVSLDPPPSGGVYSPGTTVTLTATPSSGFKFNSWSGVDSSDGTTATVTMNSNRTVYANFVQESPPPPPPGGSGTKDNPVKLNQTTDKYANSYTAKYNDITYKVTKGTKVYFEVNPIETTGKSCNSFSISIKTFNNPNMKFYKTIKNKSTGAYVVNEVKIYQNYVMGETITNSPYKIDDHIFIYTVENTGTQPGYGDDIEIWWTFIQ